MVQHVSIDDTLPWQKFFDRYFAISMVEHDSIDWSYSPFKSIDRYFASGLVQLDSIDFSENGLRMRSASEPQRHAQRRYSNNHATQEALNESNL